MSKQIVCQTIKVAGKPFFKCLGCKKSYPVSAFEPLDYIWKKDPKSYQSWIASKGIKMKDPHVS